MQCHRAKNCVPKSGPGQQATTESKTSRVSHSHLRLMQDPLNLDLQAAHGLAVGMR